SWENVDECGEARVVHVPLRGRNGEPRAWSLIDAADAKRVLQFPWYLDTYGYAITHMSFEGVRRTVLMHRFLLDAPAGICVDHRNRDRLDNRRPNLRLSTFVVSGGGAG